MGFSEYFDSKVKKLHSLDGLYKIEKLFLLNLDGGLELYARISDSEEGEVYGSDEQQEEIIEEVVQPEEGPSYVVFEEADEEELIVSDEPEIFEVELPEEYEEEEEEESMEVNDEEQAEVSSVIHLYLLFKLCAPRIPPM